MSLLEATMLCTGYGRVPVCHGINMTVESGEMVAVLGANGAGKSTLMKAIARVLPATGVLIFDGHDAISLEPHQMAEKRLGYVPQERNVFGDLTVEENLLLGGFLEKSRRQSMERVFGHFPVLGERKRQRAGTLSGGERQMLAVGSALMRWPKLLLLDEPTSGLSPQMTESLIESILEIRNEETSIVWVVEENPRDVLAHCDRAYFIEGGVVTQEGTGRSFLEDENFEALFLGRSV